MPDTAAPTQGQTTWPVLSIAEAHARLTAPGERFELDEAVIDGVPTKAFASKAADPVGGWWTAAPGASPQAPFDQPFAIIL